jgi:hypothetical protein
MGAEQSDEQHYAHDGTLIDHPTRQALPLPRPEANDQRFNVCPMDFRRQKSGKHQHMRTMEFALHVTLAAEREIKQKARLIEASDTMTFIHGLKWYRDRQSMSVHAIP